jgi:hypothetical protein
VSIYVHKNTDGALVVKPQLLSRISCIYGGCFDRLPGTLKLLAILVIALLLPASVFRAQDFSNPIGFLLAQSEDRQVWVNTATGIYHYPGTRWYGNTKQGKFMSEKDAIAQGYRAARNGQ